MLERDRLIEIGVAIPMVAIMIGAMMVVGENHKTNGTLTPEGGQLLVGTIIGFVVLMLAVGIALAYVTNDSTDGSA